MNRSVRHISLMIVGIIVLVVTIFYSNYLANQLAISERKNLELYIETVDLVANNEDLDKDITLELKIIQDFTLPVIIRGEDGEIQGINWSESQNIDEAFLKSKIAEFEKSDKKPLRGPGYLKEIFFFDTPLYTRIKYFPILQAALIALFVGLAYVIFRANRRAEQNLIWAGMAKETAHQLGTPISGIMAWIQYLKEVDPDEENDIDIVAELEKDVGRLELIADRFSKIGSVPELKHINILEPIAEIEDYMKHRSPRKMVFDFPRNQEALYANINVHLFSWVLENLIRNALDAMDGQGTIRLTAAESGLTINIDITDTGSGIPASKFKTIFKPGYSTKARGWGLGLSLAKRIVEEYHRGKIFVKHSRLNQGTTFCVQLPKPAQQQ